MPSLRPDAPRLIPGIRAAVLRYHCKGAHVNHGEHWCISFGGLRTDEVVAAEVVRAISGNAIEAALAAAEQMRRQREEQRKTLELELEQARYEVHLASRRYEAVDPDNRLVAAELEFRWNAALRKAHELADSATAVGRRVVDPMYNDVALALETYNSVV